MKNKKIQNQKMKKNNKINFVILLFIIEIILFNNINAQSKYLFNSYKDPDLPKYFNTSYSNFDRIMILGTFNVDSMGFIVSSNFDYLSALSSPGISDTSWKECIENLKIASKEWHFNPFYNNEKHMLGKNNNNTNYKDSSTKTYILFFLFGEQRCCFDSFEPSFYMYNVD